MNKTLKRILLGLAALVGVIVILFVVFFIRIQYNVKSLEPIPTGEITSEVIAIQDEFSNMYLIKDEDKYIAVDAANSAENVNIELDKLGIKASQIEAVLLTHSDADHVGALSLFPNAEVYISEKEEQMVTGETARVLFIKNKIYHKSYKLIPDGGELKIGNVQIEGILTPGHTPGAMCYLINSKYLFTGDALGLNKGEVVGFNKVFNMDTKKALMSINLITELDDVEYLLTAHYGFTNNYNAAVQSWNNK